MVWNIYQNGKMQTNTENGLPLKAVKYIKFCCFDNTNVIESAIMLLAILKCSHYQKSQKWLPR